MEKYHYDPEEYPNLKRLAGEMFPCLETEAGWQDREIQETFPGRDQSFFAVGITLGKGIDELQEKYLQTLKTKLMSIFIRVKESAGGLTCQN